MRVNVEQYHFDHGKPGDVTRCAVALAVNDALVKAGICADAISTVYSCTIRLDDPQFRNIPVTYPDKVSDFIFDYDLKKFSDKPRVWWNPLTWGRHTFKPFSFEINNVYLDGAAPWPTRS